MGSRVNLALATVIAEARDLARRLVEAHETAADAQALQALTRYGSSTYASDEDLPARQIRTAAVRALARRLAIRAGADVAKEGAP